MGTYCTMNHYSVRQYTDGGGGFSIPCESGLNMVYERCGPKDPDELGYQMLLQAVLVLHDTSSASIPVRQASY